MESSINKHQKNLSAIIHISTFSKYFIPFGNFILPLILWTSNKKESEFVDHNGKEALNFQISILLYSIIIGIITIPFFIHGVWDFAHFLDITDHNTHHIDFDIDDIFDLNLSRGLIFAGVGGIIGLGIFILDVFCTIIATIRANEEIRYRYPLTIRFIK